MTTLVLDTYAGDLNSQAWFIDACHAPDRAVRAAARAVTAVTRRGAQANQRSTSAGF